MKQSVQNYRQSHLSQNLCVFCPRQRASWSSRLCEMHLEKHRKYMLNYMRKRLGVKNPRVGDNHGTSKD